LYVDIQVSICSIMQMKLMNNEYRENGNNYKQLGFFGQLLSTLRYNATFDYTT